MLGRAQPGSLGRRFRGPRGVLRTLPPPSRRGGETIGEDRIAWLPAAAAGFDA